MRVTSNAFSDSLVSQLSYLTNRQNQLQNQVVTGQRLRSADEDPAAAQRVLQLQKQKSQAAQTQQCADGLSAQSTVVSDKIRQLQQILTKASEIAVGVGKVNSPEDLASMAKQVSGLIRDAAGLVNTQYQGNYLFGGTRSDQPPFVLTDGPSGAVASVTYQGNTSVPEVEISPGNKFSVLVPGANSTGAGATGLVTDSRTGADLFNHLVALQNHLLAGDKAAISATDQGNLSKDEDNLISQMSSSGFTQARLETASASAKSQSTAVDGLISDETGADMATTIVRLNEAQNAYKAALQSGAGLMQISLMNYLH